MLISRVGRLDSLTVHSVGGSFSNSQYRPSSPCSAPVADRSVAIHRQFLLSGVVREAFGQIIAGSSPERPRCRPRKGFAVKDPRTSGLCYGSQVGEIWIRRCIG